MTNQRVKKGNRRKTKSFTLKSSIHPSESSVKLVMAVAEMSDLSIGKPVIWQHQVDNVTIKDAAEVVPLDHEVGRVYIRVHGPTATYAHVWPKSLVILVSRKYVIGDRELERDRSRDKAKPTAAGDKPPTALMRSVPTGVTLC